jgi:hypothetical protein
MSWSSSAAMFITKTTYYAILDAGDFSPDQARTCCVHCKTWNWGRQQSVSRGALWLRGQGHRNGIKSEMFNSIKALFCQLIRVEWESNMAVILETSLGDITVDLYTNERPRCELYIWLYSISMCNPPIFFLFVGFAMHCMHSGYPFMIIIVQVAFIASRPWPS